MRALAELQVIPLGEGCSVRKQVTRVVEMLRDKGFKLETHASGTDLEGELSEILAAVEEAHKMLHASGSVRLLTYLKIETRNDKKLTLAGKRIDQANQT